MRSLGRESAGFASRRIAIVVLPFLLWSISILSCGKDATTPVTPIVVAHVEVAPATASCGVGSSVQLTATPKDASGNAITGRSITWLSANPAIATVNGSGLVSAVAAGTVKIRAMCEGDTGASDITVTPIPVSSVVVSPASGSLEEGATLALSATPLDAGGYPLGGRVVTWSSSDNLVATVDASGLVTSLKAGAATITATCEGVQGSSAITVTPRPVATVEVTPGSANLVEGLTLQLSAVAKDAGGSPLGGRVVTWSSSDNLVATVDASGLVTSLKAGPVTITATCEGIHGSSTITVTPRPVATVEVTPGSGSLVEGLTLQLSAVAKDAGGNPLDGRNVTWGSDDAGVATVSPSGLVTGTGSGTVTITATCEGVEGTSSVQVTLFGHVFVVTEENHNYAQVIGNASMPYLNGLAQQYGLATEYYANRHPSIGNYFTLATGTGVTNNDSYSTVVNIDNVVRRLLAAGKTWKSYAEDLPSVGFTGATSGKYARKHNIFALLSDVVDDPVQVNNLVPFTQFATDLAGGTLPNFCNLVPNLCNDAHDCGLATADAWLQAHLEPLLQSPTFQQDGLLIILFDEAANDSTNGGGKISWVAVSAKSKAGYQSTTFYQHQSTLRLILEALGVSSYPGAASTAPQMGEFFTSPLAARAGARRVHVRPASTVRSKAWLSTAPRVSTRPGLPRP